LNLYLNHEKKFYKKCGQRHDRIYQRSTLKWPPIFVFLALFVSACTTLQPVQLPDEHTFAPNDPPFWQSLAEIRTDTWFVLLNDGKNALDWRLTAIDSAVDSIDLQTFLWDFDTAGSIVLDRLVSAADRGVVVKILVDDTFLITEDRMLVALAEHPKIEYRIFNPFKHRASGFVSRQFFNLNEFHRLDHRMHNKAMIVDNRIAIVGGRNLADEYFGLHSEANFRDLELLAGGPIVREISASFDDYFNDDWSLPVDTVTHIKPNYVDLDAARHVRDPGGYEYEEKSEEARRHFWETAVREAFSGDALLLVDKPPVKNPAAKESEPVQLARRLIELFDKAEEEILIISAYLIPSIDLEGAIERAVQRGVDVRILTNSIRSNNHLAAHSAYRKHINELLADGAQLHEVRIDARDRHFYMFPPTDKKSLALHAKALVIDKDKVFIGSANLDPRSLRLNTEMGLLVYSEALNAELRLMLERDFSQANAWHLRFDEDGSVIWVSGNVALTSQPAGSFMQRIEDWFFMHLPIEDEM
jgi:putative cardiolipin synthase